jgi:hypothetical protein
MHDMTSPSFIFVLCLSDERKLYLGKIDAILHFPKPKTITNIRSFLGLTRYYPNYVRGYSQLSTPLFELTKRNVDFVWGSGCQQAFEALKGALVDAPMLMRPDFKK